MQRNSLATLVLLLASTLWGLSWIPLKALAGQGMDGLLLIAICYACMALVVLPWLWRNRGYLRNHSRALIGIFLAGGFANVCFNYAMIYGEVVRVMVLFYLLPVWGVLGGRFILREPTNAWRWAGVCLAISGAFILLGGADILRTPPGWLDLIALLAGMFFAATIMLFRAVELVPISIKLNMLFIGCAVIAGLLLAADLGMPRENFPVASTLAWTVVYALTWLLLANVGSQWAVTHLPAGRSAILMIVELVAAVVSAIWLGGEMLTPQVVIGGLLIVSATVIEIAQG